METTDFTDWQANLGGGRRQVGADADDWRSRSRQHHRLAAGSARMDKRFAPGGWVDKSDLEFDRPVAPDQNRTA